MPSRAWTAGELAQQVGADCRGDRTRELTGIAALDRAGPGDLSLFTGGRWAPILPHTRAGAVFLAAAAALPEGVVGLVHPRPRWAYARAVHAMVPECWPEPAVHPTAVVHPSAQVGEGVTVGALAVVEADAVLGDGTWVMAHAYVGEGVVVGARCRLMPHAVVLEGSVLGDGVRLQPGAVVGGDGFGHAAGPDGPVRIPQLGVAVLEDRVEVGANSCVDRAALGETRVGRGTRLDNLVQVAHGVRTGAHCILAAFAGLAGGAVLGDGVLMAGRSGVIDGVRVGDGAVLAGLASATRDVPDGATLGGSPAQPYGTWLRQLASLRRLPGLLRRVEALERGVEE